MKVLQAAPSPSHSRPSNPLYTGPEVGGPYGPYRQSERTPLYQTHAHKLLETGHAYRCFCTSERLRQLAEQRAALGIPTDYDRICAGISKEESDERAAQGEKHVIRLLVPDEYPEFQDLVYGHIGKGAKKKRRLDVVAYEDPILLKTDGLPTYHLANVVDDHYMQITHVIRGDEWLPSTPKHLAMYNAFGWQPPVFAHVALLVEEKGQKLSKRNFDVDVASYRDKLGIFPETLVNFVALLGWSHNSGNDCMDMEQLIERFHTKFTKGNAKVKLEKLWFLQHKHAVKRFEAGRSDELVEAIVKLVQAKPETQAYKAMLRGRTLEEYVTRIVQADAKNYTTAPDFVLRNSYFFAPGNDEARPDSFQGLRTADLAGVVHGLHEVSAAQWDATSLRARAADIVSELVATVASREGAEETELNNLQKVVNGKVLHFLRARIALGRHGPNIFEVMEILGREESLSRFGPWEWKGSG